MIHGGRTERCCYAPQGTTVVLGYILRGLPSTGVRSSATDHTEEDPNKQFTKAGALAAQYGGVNATELLRVQSAVDHASTEQAGDPKLLARRPTPAGALGLGWKRAGRGKTEHYIAYMEELLRGADEQKYALADGRKN